MLQLSLTSYRFWLLLSLLATLFSVPVNASVLHSDVEVLLKRQGCSNLESACSGTSAACVAYMCSACADISPIIPYCCSGGSDAQKVACLANELQGGDDWTSVAATGVHSTSTSPAASSTITGAAGFVACESWNAIYQSCESATPGFASLADFSIEASCLCYTSSKFAPAHYDVIFGSCFNYLSASNLTALATITTLQTAPCAALAGPTTAPYANSTALMTQSANTSSKSSTSFRFLTHPTTGTVVSTSFISSSSSSSTTASASSAGSQGMKVCDALSTTL